jgi:hypothetical protein
MALQSDPSSFILTSNLSASEASSQDVGMLRDGAIAEAGARLRGVPSSLLLDLDGVVLAFGVVMVSSSLSASALSVTALGVTTLGLAGVRFFFGVTGSTLSLSSLLVSCPSAASAAAFFALAVTAFFLGVFGSAATVAFASPILAISLSAWKTRGSEGCHHYHSWPCLECAFSAGLGMPHR